MNEVFAFATAIQNYGTDTFTIECYFFHEGRGDADIFAPVDGSWVRFRLDEEGVAVRVMLLEKTVKSVPEFVRESIAILYWASQQPSIVLAALIFDGGYDGAKEIVLDETIGQVYGIWSPSVGPILTLNRNTMMSAEWKSLVLRAKQNYASATNKIPPG